MSSKLNRQIIATIGPASFAPSIIKGMDTAGVDTFRINLSHTAVEDVEVVYTMVSSWTDKPVCPDTEGVQRRTDHRLSGLSTKDVEMLKTLNRLNASTVFLSFCSWPKDVAELQEHFDHPITIVSKIENAIGLRNLKEICKVSDGVLIDRGDLSKDIPLVKIPYAQDYIVEQAQALDTPVYVATNLMESMLFETQPTRAEVNDIIKTLDVGASGLVLAGETAIGKYPIETVRIMKRIIGVFDEYPQGTSETALIKWLINESPS